MVTNDELAGQLRLVVMRLARRLRGQLVGGVTPAQFSALASISQEGSISLGDLAVVERVSPPTMTRIVAGLVEKGLAERCIDRGDRRVSRVAIAKSGRALLQSTKTRQDAYLTRCLSQFDDREIALLERAVVYLDLLRADSGPSGSDG